MSERFYINWPLSPGPVSLDGPEAHHLAGVCRLRAGDQVTLFNGDGHEYPARLTHVARRHIDLEITACLSPRRELAFPVELAAPIPKGDRAQFLIEKLTELGVSTFVPLSCQHSVVHPREAKLDKLRRHVIEASKQCGRNVLMEVQEPIAWTTYCAQPARAGGMSILAHPDKAGKNTPSPEVRYSEPRGSAPKNPRGSEHLAPGLEPGTYRLAVGPEGGFTQEEVDLAQTAGWQTVDLGPRVLRIETAALVLASWFVSKDAAISRASH